MRALTLLAIAALALPGQAFARGEIFCRVREHPVAFDDYHASRRTAHYSIGLIEVHCPGDGPAAVSASLSTGFSGRYDDRVMVDGRSELHYNLYADPARRLVAGDGSRGTVRLRPVPFSHGGRFVFFAVIPPHQVIKPGFFRDSIFVTVEF